MAYPARRGRSRRRLRAAAASLLTLALAVPLHSAAPPVLAHLPDDMDWFLRLEREQPAVEAVAPTPLELALSAPPPAGPAWDGTVAPSVESAAAVVLDADSGELLYGQNPHRRLPPASITKIVTAMVALERGDLDTSVTVDIDGPAFAIATDSSIMGLHAGDTLTLRDLLYGLMLPSGNDAAVAIARHIAGDEASFVDLMNQKVAQLGLQDTHFSNPHGLNAPDHYTSAYDIAQLGLWAMRDERFREIVRTPAWLVRGSRIYTVWNLNGLLASYPGATGLKTGWHEQAGMTIVGSATRNDRHLIVSLLNDSRQLLDSAALLDWAFAHFRWE